MPQAGAPSSAVLQRLAAAAVADQRTEMPAPLLSPHLILLLPVESGVHKARSIWEGAEGGLIFSEQMARNPSSSGFIWEQQGGVI